MGFNDIDIKVSGPIQPTATYKTKVLKGNHSFVSQLTQENTIYVIRYDFDLDGDVTIPANCVLEFEGGSLIGGTLIGNKTTLSGKVQLDTLFAGTFINSYIKISELINKTSTRVTGIITSLFNIGLGIFIDEDITLDGSLQRNVAGINIAGDGHTISNPNKYTTNGNIIIHDVCFDSYSATPNAGKADTFIHINNPSDEYSYIIDIDNIKFDGNGLCDRFLNHNTSTSIDLGSISYILVLNSTFTNVASVVFNLRTTIKRGIISNNIFKEIGHLTIQKYITACIWLGKNAESQMLYVENVTIRDNVCKNLKTVYIEGVDVKESKGIILYGQNNVIENNIVDTIYSNQPDGDPGAETEGIYVKGRCNYIINNYVANATGGNNSNGCITLKTGDFDLQDYNGNVIDGNIIYFKFSNGITTYCNYGLVSNNTIIGSGKCESGIDTLNASYNIFKGNNIKLQSTEGTIRAAFTIVGTSNSENVIQGNRIEGCGIRVFTVGKTYIKDNIFILKDLILGTSIKDNTILKLNKYVVDETIEVFVDNCTFYIQDCKASALMDSTITDGNVHINGCKFAFRKSEGTDSIFNCIFRNGNWSISNTSFDIDDNYPISYIFRNDAATVGEIFYSTFNKKLPILNNAKTIGNIGAKESGTFAEKPTSNYIPVGFKYFCTDKQTTEGATDGIEIIHKGNNVWVDALGRVVS